MPQGDPINGPVISRPASIRYQGAPVPATAAAFRPFLQAAIRAAEPANPLFSGAVVRLERNRYRVTLGRTGAGFEPGATITFANGATADALGLSANGGGVVSGQQFPLAGGDDGGLPDAAALRGVRADRTGMYALEDADLFNILCIPRAAAITANNGADMRQLCLEATAYCEERRSFLIVDVPENTDFDDMQTWLDDNNGLRHRNAAVYFPRVRVADPLNQNRPRSLAPSGTMAGLYARTDGERGVWKAPAGTEVRLRVQELDEVLTDPQNGVLNPLGVNCLWNFPVFGNISWGARTLDGADQIGSEWKYVPVRRLALFIEESLFRGTKWVGSLPWRKKHSKGFAMLPPSTSLFWGHVARCCQPSYVRLLRSFEFRHVANSFHSRPSSRRPAAFLPTRSMNQGRSDGFGWKSSSVYQYLPEKPVNDGFDLHASNARWLSHRRSGRAEPRAYTRPIV